MDLEKEYDILQAHSLHLEQGVESILEKLGLDIDNYQSWSLLFDGIALRIDELKLQDGGTTKDKGEQSKLSILWHLARL